jgi:hypothetical protein
LVFFFDWFLVLSLTQGYICLSLSKKKKKKKKITLYILASNKKIYPRDKRGLGIAPILYDWHGVSTYYPLVLNDGGESKDVVDCPQSYS